MEPYYSDDLVTLYHGDCLEIDEWPKADVLVTDPPYGITAGRLGSHQWKQQVHADVDWDRIELRDWALDLWGDRPRAVFGSPKNWQSAPEYRGVPLIWDKGDSPRMGDHTWPFGSTYELIWLRGNGWKGHRRSSVIRQVPPDNARTALTRTIDHPTPKPVALMEVLISYAPPGVIADPFAGSGSTLVAAVNQGRKAIGVELEERYCEIIARRLSNQTMVLDFG